MELIYLWVNKYKNLSGGYNLSAKYKVTAQADTLVVNHDENYIENLFDPTERVKISGIIGENGCGKTSILKTVISLIYNHHLTSNKRASTPVDSFLLLEMDRKFYYINNGSSPSKKVKFGPEVEHADVVKPLDVPCYAIYFNYMLDSLKDNDDEDYWIEEIYHKSDDYNVPCLIEPYKKNNMINISNLDYLTRQRMMLHRKALNSNSVLRDIFSPTQIKLKLDVAKIIKVLRESGNFMMQMLSRYKEDIHEIMDLMSEKENAEIELNSLGGFTRYRLINKKEKETDIKLKISHLEADLTSKLLNVPLFIINNLYIANKIDKYNSQNEKSNIKLVIVDNVIKAPVKDRSHSTLKLRNAIKYGKCLSSSPDSFEKYERVRAIEKNDSFLPSWFELQLRDDSGRTLSSLSSGEKNLYIFISTLIYQINNIKSRWRRDHSKEYHNILLLLDEADIGLHPKWQRKYISYLIDSLKSYKGLYFHLLCTSHSPFIVSDLPKNHMLFLDNGIVTSLHNSQNTFGANIHTLLHDSFFMQEDMMMGKFAEVIIENIFNFGKKIFALSDELKQLENDNGAAGDLKKVKYDLVVLKEQYLKDRDFFINISKTVGEAILSTAIRNNISEIDVIFHIQKPDNVADRIVDILNGDPKLLKDVLERIK